MSGKTVLRIFGYTLVVLVFLFTWQAGDVHALLGDLDYSGLVDSVDLDIIDAAYGARNNITPPSANWDARADINLDELVNLKDLALAGRSFGDTFNFYPHRRISNGRDNNPSLTNPYWCDAVADEFGRVHVIWEEDRISNDYLYYTQLDASGNALIEDVMISNDSLYARLDVGPDGSAHLVYQRHYSNSGIYYVKLNFDGSFVNGGGMIPDGIDADNPAIAVDEYGHAHLVYSQSGDKVMYSIIGDNGDLLPATQLNPWSTTTASAPVITISPDGARHILWRQATGIGGGELRYSRITKDGVLTSNNKTVATLLGTYNLRHYYLAADSQNTVHLMYYDFRSGTMGIYWRLVNPDGTVTSETLISNNVINSSAANVSYVIDSADRLHLVASWVNGNGHVGYARLGQDGGILVPFQRVVFAAETNKAVITINDAGQAMIIAPAASGSPEPLFIFSTVVDPAAYDTNRADLVLDKAHLGIADYLLKITEQADITVTVTNGGPALASGVMVNFSYPDVGGTISQFDVSIGDLAAFTSFTFQQLIDVPDFEEVDAWEVTISAITATLETTTTNNTVTTPFGVIPPPTMFNIEVQPFDETNSPTDRDLFAEPLPDAVLTLDCPSTGHHQMIDATDLFNVFWDIPLGSTAPLYPTTCTVTLTKEGFSSAAIDVSAQRLSEANPYAIQLSPRLIKLYVNTWGRVEGIVTEEGGKPIGEALVKFDSGQVTTTDKDGYFVLEKIPAGNHTLQVWAAWFEPIQSQAAEIIQGHVTPLNLTMRGTTRADIFGVVHNDLGLPMQGAEVVFIEDGQSIDSMTTGSDGSFAFSVDPYEELMEYRLAATLNHYLPLDEVLVGLTPGIPLGWNLFLSYDGTGADMKTSGEITSWEQDERWCKAYGEDEDLPLNKRILQAIGSKWCPSFETVVNWGAFDYELGLNYSEDISGKTVTELLINFTNADFMSYGVRSGGWNAGGATLSVTAQRIDWVELIAIDGNGNPVGDYVWHDETVRYSSTQTDPVNPTWRIPINELAPTWSQAAIRIFYTIGEYAAGANMYFKGWDPPADLGLSGSGAPSGANRQVITWFLKYDISAMRYSLADYRSAADLLSSFSFPVVEPSFVDDMAETDQSMINALANVAVTPVTSGPARLGTPYAVDITISGLDSQPVYAMEFDLAFNKTYFRLVDIQPAPDFAGTYGSWHRNFDLGAINSGGRVDEMAVVRLAAQSGLAIGKVIRLVFLPIKITLTPRTLDFAEGLFATIDSDTFVPASVTDLSVTVEEAKLFLPVVLR